MYEKIIQKSELIEDELIELRRNLHMYPELGWEEFRTTAIIVERLRDMGYEVLVGQQVCDDTTRMGLPPQADLDAAYERALEEGADPNILQEMTGGFTGAVAILRNGDGPTVGMRFDIDALPLFETEDEEHFPNREAFRSQHDGVMHACGHDGHICIGLGTAQVLMDLREHWSGTIKLLFQPAEEGVRGAKSMVAKGHLDDAGYMLGSHITDSCNSPGSDLFSGAGGAMATTKLDVFYHGFAAHAGETPEKGRNALQAMACAITALYGIPRNSKADSRINVGVARAGVGRNIIAAEAEMQIEIRGITTEVNQYMVDQAVRIIQAAADMYAVEYEISKVGEAISLESDPELMDIITEASRKVGLVPAEPSRMVSPGSEDYSYMMEKVQSNGGLASFIRVLSEEPSSAHTVKFDFAENTILHGVKAFSASVFSLLGR